MTIRQNTPFARRSLASLIGCACLLSAAAEAQAQREPGRHSMALEEVVVTAQRRQESLQESPVAITALDGNMVERRGIRNAEDLIGTVPSVGGFEAPGNRGDVSLSIRGISGGSPANLSSDPANAIYLDNIYLGKMAGLALDVADIERIEILRGPQGTLYGRNSTGGALNIITRKPSGELEGKLTVTAGNYDLWGANASLHLPAIGREDQGLGRLAASFNYYVRQRDEIYGNTNPHEKGFEDLDREAWRVALNWRPTSRTEIDYIYDHSKLDELPVMNHVIGFTPMTGPSDGNLDRLDMLKGFQQAVQYGLLSDAQQNDPTFSRWLSSVGFTQQTIEQKLSGGKSRPSRGSADSRTDNYQKAHGHSLTLTFGEYDMGALGDVTLRAITGQRKLDNRNGGDLDGMDNALIAGGAGAINDSTLAALYGLYEGQEAGVDTRAQTAQLWNLIDAWGGGYAFYTADKEYEQFSQEFQIIGATARTNYVLGLYWFEDEGSSNDSGYYASPVAGNTLVNYENETEAWAVFSQATWRPPVLQDRLSLTAGLRYTEEKKRITYNFLNTYSPLDPRYTGEAQEMPEAPLGSRFSESFSNVSGMVNVAYQFTDDLNAYITYATGYRSGGFNGEVFNNPIEEESVQSWELGLKSDWWDNRLRINTALWRYEYEDMQANQILVDENGATTSNIVNAGKAKRWGWELEAQVIPLEDLLVGFSYSYIHGDFDDYPSFCADLNCIENSSSLARRGMSPGNQVSVTLDYVFVRGHYGWLTGHIAAHWQDRAYASALWTGTYGDEPNTEIVAYDNISIDERTVVNANLSLEEIPIGNGRARISLWAKNLFNQDYNTYGINFAALGPITQTFGEPRTYGLDLTYEF